MKSLVPWSSPRSGSDDEISRLRKQVRKLERDYESLLKNSQISEEIADNSKKRLLRAQSELEAEIVERKRVEREFYRVIQEAEEAIALKQLFVDQLSDGLSLPILAAKKALGLLGTRHEGPEDRGLIALVELQLDMLSGVVERIRRSASHHSRKDEELSVAIHVLMRAAERALQLDLDSDDLSREMASEIRKGASALLDADERERKD